MLSAVIFMKRLADAKSRLAPLLTPLERTALATRLLVNVVEAARRTSGVGEVVVVSPDRIMPAIVGRDDVRHLREPRPNGLNAAIEFASAKLAVAGHRRVLLLPADLPRIQPKHIEALIDAHRQSASDIIVPANDGNGTNALLIEIPPRFPLAFGPDSLTRHIANAARARQQLVVHGCPAIGADVDLPGDLHLMSELVS